MQEASARRKTRNQFTGNLLGDSYGSFEEACSSYRLSNFKTATHAAVIAVRSFPARRPPRAPQRLSPTACSGARACSLSVDRAWRDSFWHRDTMAPAPWCFGSALRGAFRSQGLIPDARQCCVGSHLLDSFHGAMTKEAAPSPGTSRAGGCVALCASPEHDAFPATQGAGRPRPPPVEAGRSARAVPPAPRGRRAPRSS
jgi:hypothetical protein